MKSTGIVKTVDDLGRVAIPKSVREQLGIFEGDELEVFVNERISGESDAVIFKKYKSDNGAVFLEMVKNLIYLLSKEDEDYSIAIDRLNQATKYL